VRKPAALRAHLTQRLPELKLDAGQLQLYVDTGSLASTFVPGHSFEYRYTLNVVVTEFAQDPDIVMATLLEWIHIEQQELSASPQQRDAITFKMDALADEKMELSIKIPLSERVVVRRNDDGTFEVTNPPEPTPAQEWTPV
jgi:hypothetical protein